jgi:hypothetical protein
VRRARGDGGRWGRNISSIKCARSSRDGPCGCVHEEGTNKDAQLKEVRNKDKGCRGSGWTLLLVASRTKTQTITEGNLYLPPAPLLSSEAAFSPPAPALLPHIRRLSPPDPAAANPPHANPSGRHAAGEILTFFSSPRRQNHSSTIVTFTLVRTWPGRRPHHQDPKGGTTPPIPTVWSTSPDRQLLRSSDLGSPESPKPRTLTLPAASPCAALLHHLQWWSRYIRRRRANSAPPRIS